MPVYLLHGFRWPRALIRIHIILQNLEDAAADWIVAPETQRTIIHSFHKKYPGPMTHLQNLRFVEQYDPADTTTAEQPHAYVADFVEEIKLDIDIDEVRSKGIANEQWGAITELRDQLVPDSKIGWYIVVCGDEERWAPSPSPPPTDAMVPSVSSAHVGASSDSDSPLPAQPPSVERNQQHPADIPEPKGLKKFWSATRLGRRKSRPNLQNDLAAARVPPMIDSQLPPQMPFDPAWHSSSPINLTNGTLSGSEASTAPSDPPDDLVELSASPPTRDGPSLSTAPTSTQGSGSVSPLKPGSIAPSTRSRNVSPLRRSSVAPSTVTSAAHSRAVSPTDTFRAAHAADRSTLNTQSAETQRKRGSRRFSLQSFQRSNPSTVTAAQPPVTTTEEKRASRRLSLQSFQLKSVSTPNSNLDLTALPPAQVSTLSHVPAEEQMQNGEEEVITVSPAVRSTPSSTQAFRRSRGSRNSLLLSTTNNSQVYLSSPLSALSEHGTSTHFGGGVVSTSGYDMPDVYRPSHGPAGAMAAGLGGGKAYFGQAVSQFDLIANNIENALIAMR